MTKIKNIALWTSAVLGALFLIVNASQNVYNSFSKRVIKTEEEKQQTIEQNKNIDYLISENISRKTTDSVLILKMDNLLDTVKLVYVKQISISGKFNVLNTGFTKHLESTKQLDELIYYLKQFQQ